MKMIFNTLAGIAILFGSVIGSVATATTTTSTTDVDEVCYKHVIIGLTFNTSRTRWIRIYVGDVRGVGFDARVKVYNDAGTLIVPNHDITIPANGSHQVGIATLRGGAIGVETHGQVRNVHITTDEDALVVANYFGHTPATGVTDTASLPVYKRPLTNTKTWEAPCDPPDDKKS